MPDEVYRKNERLLMARMFIEMGRLFHRAYLARQRYGVMLDVVPIAVSVFVAQLQGRNAHASGIAAMLQMPRNTVQRKLAWLAKQGVMEKHGRYYSVPLEKINSKSAQAAVDDLLNLVRQTAHELSKMEQQNPCMPITPDGTGRTGPYDRSPPTDQ